MVDPAAAEGRCAPRLSSFEDSALTTVVSASLCYVASDESLVPPSSLEGYSDAGEGTTEEKPPPKTPAFQCNVAPVTSSVMFRVRIPCQRDDRIRLVGSWPSQTGVSEEEVTASLMTTNCAFPFYVTTKPLLLPLKKLFTYRYQVQSSNTTVWRDWDKQRSVIPTGITMVVEDDDGLARGLFSSPCSCGGTCIQSSTGPITVRAQTSLSSSRPSSSPPHFDAKEEDRETASGRRPLDDSLLEDEKHASRGAPRCSITGRPPPLPPASSASESAGSGLKRKDPSDIVRELYAADTVPVTNENDTLIIASFALPLRVVKNEDGSFAVEKQKSLLMPQLHALRRSVRLPVRFVGWPGVIARSDEEKREIEELLEPHDCVPVHLTEATVESYLNFCHQCLWPLFHNVVALHLYDKRPFKAEQWMAYQSVNRDFANVVIQEAHEEDLIWIHDYYLLLVPQFITRRLRKANVGLFLHVPFPSSEVFRCLPFREEVLRGMLCADLVGFHFFEYARHFLVVNKRLLGLEHYFRMGGFLELDYGGRSVMVRIGHVHIQYDDLRKTVAASDEVKVKALRTRTRYSCRFIFASVDRCERLAGIILKLRGFQHFLRNYPYAAASAMLLQYAYPTAHNWDNQQGYFEEMRGLADEINAEFGVGKTPEEQPVILKVRSISAVKKYALFQAADCLLDTSVRDGLNLSPFEYICCRKDKPAPLILSEFTGCCRTLASALRVNPWKAEDIAQAMDRAMNSTTQEDMRDRFLRDQTYLQKNSTLQWAEEFLQDLRRARKKEDLVYVSWGFGNSYRVYGVDSHFRYLDCERVIQAFKEAKRPVLFFDHEGTLAPDRRLITAIPGEEALSATGAAPSPHILRCLATLCASGVTVVILSGRDRKLLEEWFGAVAGLGLCAEHGFYYRVPQISGNRWLCILPSKNEDFTWKQIATELMKQYVKRTQGAIIENKGSALVFQYRDADPDFGSWQAKELSNYLEDLLFGCPVTVVSGKGYVEVKLRGVNKGQAVETVLKKIGAHQSSTSYLQPEAEKNNKVASSTAVDFILCIGDDRSDEDMFSVVNAFFEQVPEPEEATTSAGIATPPLTAVSDPAVLVAEPLVGGPDGVLLDHNSHEFLTGSCHPSGIVPSVVSNDTEAGALRCSAQDGILLHGVAPRGKGNGSSLDLLDPLGSSTYNNNGSNGGCMKSNHPSIVLAPVVATLIDDVENLGAVGEGMSYRSRSFSRLNRKGFWSTRNKTATPSVTFPVSFSVTVGKKPSHARHYLNDIEEVSELLHALAQYAEKTKR